MTVSVIHALDLAFNKGKGNILSTWSESIAGDLMKKAKKTKREKQVVTDRTMALFESMPKFTVKKKR